MDLYNEYLQKFKEEPLLLWGLNFDHPIYQKLFKKAIDRGYPLTNKEIGRAFKGVNMTKSFKQLTIFSNKSVKTLPGEFVENGDFEITKPYKLNENIEIKPNNSFNYANIFYKNLEKLSEKIKIDFFDKNEDEYTIDYLWDFEFDDNTHTICVFIPPKFNSPLFKPGFLFYNLSNKDVITILNNFNSYTIYEPTEELLNNLKQHYIKEEK